MLKGCHLMVRHETAVWHSNDCFVQTQRLKEAARAGMADDEVCSLHVGMQRRHILHEFHAEVAGQLGLVPAPGHQHMRQVLSIAPLHIQGFTSARLVKHFSRPLPCKHAHVSTRTGFAPRYSAPLQGFQSQRGPLT